MANVLDSVTLAQPVARAGNPQGGQKEPTKELTIEDVRQAVNDFLKKQPDVREVCVTKLVQIDTEKGTWEAEADVYVPNVTVQALGLPLTKEVLDRQEYILRLDGRLHIAAYGLRELVGRSERSS